MKFAKLKNKIKERRSKRTRAKIFGTAEKPRLSVFKSNKHTYAQLIDDIKSNTLVSASTMEIKKSGKIKKIDLSKSLGALIAEKATKAKIKQAIFDRGPYPYHGRVKNIAEGARESGLKI
ncbi:MAG: large subunit ribosomal protein L18 [Parcubacteria group bacterium Athens0714_26]|nr:MAG: large subunit ribosomal protein L18 [Parcubacteria group bacterium Athens1014_26]TSD03281.1 MAG: large subunit ribosomal protein L18 [Parcubacteria group bacterium Athens0714_26]